MSLHACGSIHQGRERFSGQSRGKLCSSLSALLNAQNIPVIETVEHGNNRHYVPQCF